MFMMKRVVAAVVSCLVLLSGCPLTAQGGYTGTVNTKAAKQANARQQCLNLKPPSSSPSSSSSSSSSSLSSCDLSALAPQQHEEFWTALSSQELKAGSTYWVGAAMFDVLQWKESKKPLVESLGCYVKAEGLSTDVKRRRYNGPERCLTQCTTNIVGLQDETCYCLKEEEVTSQQQRPLDECHVMCSSEPYRCGGHNSSISVYKIPDGTLYEKRGKPKTFFWQRSQNNENEFIVISNRAGNQKKQFCVSADGVYSSVALKEACPSGGKVVNFEDVKVRDFLSGTGSMSVDWSKVSFALPLEYSKKLSWLDGGVVRGAGGRGKCVSVTYDGLRFSLQREKCSRALPSICACYSQSQTTEPPTTTTTTTTTTPDTTTTTAASTTTTTTDMTTTTTTTTTESTTTMTDSTTTMAEPSSTTTTATTQTPSETTSTTFSTTTPETSTRAGSSTTETMTTTTTMVTMTTTTTPGGGNKTSRTTMMNAVGLEEEAEPEVKPERNSSMLFPFSDMNDEGDAPNRAVDPTGGNSAESTAEGGEGTASASTSIGMIVGTSVGLVALILIVVIVVVVVRRRRKESPNSSLLKNKAQKPASSTSYPI